MPKTWLIWGTLALITLIWSIIIGYSMFLAPDPTPSPRTPIITCNFETQTVHGRVMNADTTPIAQATITLKIVGELKPNDCNLPPTPATITAQTDPMGYFTMTVDTPPHWLHQLNITAEGFRPYIAPPVNGVYLPYFADADLILYPETHRIFG